MWTIFKVFIEFITLLLLFYAFFFFLGHETCRILASRPGIEPAPSVLEGQVITTGLPEESLSVIFVEEFLLIIHLYEL